LRTWIARGRGVYAGLSSAAQAGALLGIFSFIGLGSVGLVHWMTASIILEQERAALLQGLHGLVPVKQHDNDMLRDTLVLNGADVPSAPDPCTVYRARRGGRPVAVVLTAVAPDGYSGAIRLLVAIREDGVLAGVRVVAHKETPGLGDQIEAAKSDWIRAFSGRSLRSPDEKRWAVKRDGGVFDQFTGATVTPRAVVGAVYRSLVFFRAHREALFAPLGAGQTNGSVLHD
jgi:electron transport complex protein RnfG